MGYYLNLLQDTPSGRKCIFWGTKYYGYVGTETCVKSESYNYLKNIDKLPVPEWSPNAPYFWQHSDQFTTSVRLTYEEFLNFINYYNRDYMKFDYLKDKDYNLMNDERIKSLIDSKKDVYVFWG